jgi:(1->4)-alpha-D-glucan 1-alpha-D-glucosylmutase
MPKRLRESVQRLRALMRQEAQGAEPGIGAGDEYLFYQTAFSTWPLGWDGEEGRDNLRERLISTLLKASREAKLHTSWLRSNEAYEQALARFVERAVDSPAFRRELAALLDECAPHAAINGLSQTVLRLCSPGVADTYQGSELWNHSLVDPDNRRDVDFGLRARWLSSLRERTREHTLHDTSLRVGNAALAAELLAQHQDGRVKLYVTYLTLRLRRSLRTLFLRGEYEPLLAGENVVAFARSFERRRVVVCVPRFHHKLTRGRAPFACGEVWRDTKLPMPGQGSYRNVLTDESFSVRGSLRLSELLRHFPLALLVQEEGG